MEWNKLTSEAKIDIKNNLPEVTGYNSSEAEVIIELSEDFVRHKKGDEFIFRFRRRFNGMKYYWEFIKIEKIENDILTPAKYSIKKQSL